MKEIPPPPEKLGEALTLTRLAQATKSPEMLKQHLDRIEQLLEYVIRQETHGQAQGR